MATFYFNNAAADGDWQTLGNWWMSYDAETNTFSVPATGLPTSTDDIEVHGYMWSNTGGNPTVANVAIFDSNSGNPGISITLTVTGNCTLSGYCFVACPLLTVNGHCTFSNGSVNGGTITGDCTFNTASYSNEYGTINGDCVFNDGSYNGGTITGLCTFNDGSNNQGTVTGDCTFNNSANGYILAGGFVIGDCTFNDSYNGPGSDVNGNCIFNGNSGNGGSVNNAVFNDSATLYWADGSDYYPGRVAGNCTLTVASAALTLDGWGFQIGQASFGWIDRIEGTIEIKYDKGINGSSILGLM